MALEATRKGDHMIFKSVLFDFAEGDPFLLNKCLRIFLAVRVNLE